jgi:hypothetical protein
LGAAGAVVRCGAGDVVLLAGAVEVRRAGVELGRLGGVEDGAGRADEAAVVAAADVTRGSVELRAGAPPPLEQAASPAAAATARAANRRRPDRDT